MRPPDHPRRRRLAAWFRRRRWRSLARELVSDTALLAGAAGVVYGVHELTPPGAWIAGGALAMLVGWILGRSR